MMLFVIQRKKVRHPKLIVGLYDQSKVRFVMDFSQVMDYNISDINSKRWHKMTQKC